MAFNQIGKQLILFGALIILVGLIVSFSDRIPFLGMLPDILSSEIAHMKRPA